MFNPREAFREKFGNFVSLTGCAMPQNANVPRNWSVPYVFTPLRSAVVLAGFVSSVGLPRRRCLSATFPRTTEITSLLAASSHQQCCSIVSRGGFPPLPLRTREISRLRYFHPRNKFLSFEKLNSSLTSVERILF